MNWCYLRGEDEEANIWPLGEAETAESAENALFMSVNFVPAEPPANRISLLPIICINVTITVFMIHLRQAFMCQSIIVGG